MSDRRLYFFLTNEIDKIVRIYFPVSTYQIIDAFVQMTPVGTLREILQVLQSDRQAYNIYPGDYLELDIRYGHVTFIIDLCGHRREERFYKDFVIEVLSDYLEAFDSMMEKCSR